MKDEIFLPQFVHSKQYAAPVKQAIASKTWLKAIFKKSESWSSSFEGVALLET